MKKIFIILLAICLFFQARSVCAVQQEYDPLNTLLTLNYAIMSIYRVEKLPSKVTIDEEYNGIINNLAVGNISDDQELLDLFTSMMAAYTENRLDEKDRELIRRQYEVQVNRAFLQIKPLSHIATEAAVSASQQFALQSGSGNWVGALLGSAATGIGEYTLALQANERIKMQAQGEEQEYMQQRMSQEWQLDKEKIRRFNSLKMNLLSASWRLLNKYNLPDSGRLTEDNISQFYNFISEQDTVKALRVGKRIEKDFEFYPPFWFYYGVFAINSNNLQKARECFEKFETISRPILRKDQFMAAMARYKIFTLDKDEIDEAKNLLNIIEEHSASDDWNNYLFASLQWYQLGERQKADDLILRNIDMGLNVPICSEIYNQLKTGKINLNAVHGIAIREFSEPTELEKLANAGNTEAQYRLGNILYQRSFGGNQKKAIEWLSKAAKNNHIFAQCKLADIERGNEENIKFLNDNISIIFKELEEISKYNNEAFYYLGLLYSKGIGVKKDLRKAFEYFKKASDHGLPIAQAELAYYYAKGKGVSKDLNKSFEWYKKAAEQGYPIAQIWMAIFYSDGEAVSKDLNKSFEWYKKAAKQGNPIAQSALGSCYEDGTGVNKDLKKAFEWYRKAAEQGHNYAQLHIGRCYEKGLGVNKDLNKAFEWYQKSAEQGNAYAQYDIGRCYEEGIGVNKDLNKAFEWYQKSAEQGNPRGQLNLGYFYNEGIGVNKDLNKAFEWYQKSAEQGNATAQNNLGYFYQNGFVVNKDLNKAFEWYKKAAEQGAVIAQNNLGYFYEKGFGITKDLNKAFEWYKKAAEQGNDSAQFHLAFLYENGLGVKKNLSKAFEWYKKAAEQGNEYAQLSLGSCYHKGKGISKDFINAFEWYKKSAEQGNAIAQYNLAFLYENGLGVKKNLSKAFEWYKKAAEQGDEYAQQQLTKFGF